jgi:patatin-like phospholipase/acyl hydrolase
MATAAAPTYFPAYMGKNGATFVDGGIWANCPAAVGIIEATGYLKRLPQEIDLLSIGTTSCPYNVSRKKGKGGWLLWNKDLVELQMRAQVHAALAQCQVLTDHRLLRVDSNVTPGRFSLDDQLI